MWGIKIPQQDFALKMQGRLMCVCGYLRRYLRDTTVVEKGNLYILELMGDLYYLVHGSMTVRWTSMF